jgi:hypothetical protein
VSRTNLHTILKATLGSDNVYFQPPGSVQMNYPAIVYSISGTDTESANDQLYLFKKKYTVILIDKDPDTTVFDKIAKLPYSKFDRHYNKDSLNHFVFSLYY